MRALLLCTGDIMAAGVLKGWLDAGHEVAEIWHGPQPSLRRSQRTLSRWAPDWSVRRVAERHAVPLFCNPALRNHSEIAARIETLGAEVLISAVTMQIVPPWMIDHFKGRAANFHPALLPHYRGPSPLIGQILDGRENECGGMTVHQLTAGIDEGPIISSVAIPFDSVARSYEAWWVANAIAARQLAREILPAFFEGRVSGTVQGPGSYRRTPELHIDGNSPVVGVEAMLERIGATGRARAGGKAIRRFVARLGKPTGQPPKVGALHVDLDVADARIRLRRFGALNDLRRRLEQLSSIRQMEREAQL